MPPAAYRGRSNSSQSLISLYNTHPFIQGLSQHTEFPLSRIMTKPLLITGATGEQGGSVIDALTASPSLPPPTAILAVTRNASSQRAQQLTRKSPAIGLVEGNSDNVPTIFDRALAATDGSPIWGVISVQTFFCKGASVETEKPKAKVSSTIASSGGFGTSSTRAWNAGAMSGAGRT